jgi:lipopolysaccharide transport system ATP-binding protein
MTKPIIQVEHLSKRYRIGARAKQVDSIRDTVANSLRSPFRYLAEMLRPPTEEETLWALRDISFNVVPGEVIGLIGRNGAGKSTLLKILSRITQPAQGRAVLHGRMGSLLEVGTGFHPDLTGRENIYLNGTILGMRKTEIDRKFDEIVAFSDVSRFLDTPVKRYSSGMYVRLAFAVAAHLEPEILLVDEVLAVGDLAFQRKCLGKMESLAGEDGRTVIFVSHNMQSIRALCPRSLFLREGRLQMDGPTSEVQAAYYAEIRRQEITAETAVNDPRHRRGSGAVRYTSIQMQNTQNDISYDFMMGDTVRFVLDYQVFEPVDELYCSIVFRSGKTAEVVTSALNLLTKKPLKPGYKGQCIVEFANLNIRPGDYPLQFWLGNHLAQAYDVVEELTLPLIVSTDQAFEQVGFNPSYPVGYYNISSLLVSNTAS